jgi:hypothetical protein
MNRARVPVPVLLGPLSQEVLRDWFYVVLGPAAPPSDRGGPLYCKRSNGAHNGRISRTGDNRENREFSLCKLCLLLFKNPHVWLRPKAALCLLCLLWLNLERYQRIQNTE